MSPSEFTKLETMILDLQKSMNERFDRVDARLDSFDEKTDALCTLSNQSFSAISEIRSEVAPPWKSGRSFSAQK